MYGIFYTCVYRLIVHMIVFWYSIWELIYISSRENRTRFFAFDFCHPNENIPGFLSKATFELELAFTLGLKLYVRFSINNSWLKLFKGKVIAFNLVLQIREPLTFDALNCRFRENRTSNSMWRYIIDLQIYTGSAI